MIINIGTKKLPPLIIVYLFPDLFTNYGVNVVAIGPSNTNIKDNILLVNTSGTTIE